jgi:hypothetical protein
MYEKQLECHECPCQLDFERWENLGTWEPLYDDSEAANGYQARYCRICGWGRMRRSDGRTDSYGLRWKPRRPGF